MGRKLYIDDDHRQKCPRCKGQRITEAYERTDDPLVRIERYSGKEVSVESEDYQVHYDCYVCLDCGCFDFPSAFDYSTRTTEAYCPECQEEKTYRELEWDGWTGQLRIKCVDCGHEYRCQMGRNAEVVKILEPLYATIDDFYRILNWLQKKGVYEAQLDDFIDGNLEAMLEESKDTKIAEKRIKTCFWLLSRQSVSVQQTDPKQIPPTRWPPVKNLPILPYFYMRLRVDSATLVLPHLTI